MGRGSLFYLDWVVLIDNDLMIILMVHAYNVHSGMSFMDVVHVRESHTRAIELPN